MAFLELVAWELGFAGNETHGQLLARHLEREEGHGLLEVHSDVAGHGKGASRLTHSRTRGKDDKGARLETRRHAVQSNESALQTTQAIALLASLLDLVHGQTDEVSHRMVIRTEILVVDVHQALLRFVEEIHNVGGLVVGFGDGLGGDTYHLALDVFLAEHTDMVLNMCCRDNILCEFRYGIGTTGGLQFAVEAEAFHHRQQVHRLALLEEFADGFIYRLMFRLIEIFHMQGLNGVDERRLVKHEGSQHTLLKRNGLWRRIAVDVECLGVCYSVFASCGCCWHIFRSQNEITKLQKNSDLIPKFLILNY